MKEKMMIITGLLAVTIVPAFAASASAEDTVAELKEHIKTLQKRVEQLEAKQKDPAKEDRMGFVNRSTHQQQDLFERMDQVREQVNRVFGERLSEHNQHQFGSSFPNRIGFHQSYEFTELDDSYKLSFDMAGFEEDQVDIEVHEHSITFKGKYNQQESQEGDNHFYSSHAMGSFMKTIPLPVDADTNNLETEHQGDSLVIRLPKKTS